MSRRTFNERVVVVTGAAGGIGRALAARFARAGARLALLDVREDALADAASALDGVDTLQLPCDITDADACAEAVRAVTLRFGGIDVLINNAGLVHRSGFAETEIEVFRRVMGVNFFGSLYCAKAAYPSLKHRRGLIVVVSSIAGLAPLYGRSGYAASKHALHGLFESARSEMAQDGIGLLMVCPGFTRTGFEQAALGPKGERTGRPRSMVGGIAEPDDVAEAIFQAAQTGDRMLILSPVGKLTALLSRLAPSLYERLMVNRLKGELE